MGASAHIGRVGGLAVALGVGAAIATGHGVAWATEGDTTASTSEQSTTTDTTTDNTTSPAQVEADPDEEQDVEELEDVEESTDDDAEDTEPEETDDSEGVDEPTDTEEPTETESEDADETEDVDDTASLESEADPQATRETDGSDGLAVDSDSNALTDTANVVARTVEVNMDPAGADDDVAEGLPSATQVVDQARTFFTTIEHVGPAITAAPEAAPQPFLQRIVLNVLSSLGVASWAANLPGAPIWSPFAMALLGLGSRREFNQPVSPLTRTVGTEPVAALTLTDLAAAAAVTTYPGTTRKPVYVSGNTHWIEFVTGPGNLNNTTQRFGIGGTDLGIMWDNGIVDNPATAVNEHQVLIAFGDTFSNRTPVRTGVWRFNTLFRSADGVLNNGLYVPDGVPVNHTVLPPNGAHFSGSPMENPNWSDPILPSPGDPVHPPYAVGTEVTIIPTAGISVPHNNAYGARQYMSFMSVRSWDTAGRWTTNYSGVAYSDDNGQTWDIAPTSIRSAATGRATVPFVSGNQNFQQFAFVKPPAGSPEATQGWVYAYGTPSGRAGTVYLSRVQQTQIADTTKYQYWNGSTWVANAPSSATPLLPGKTSSFFGFFSSTSYPAVSEMSVQYNPYLKKYVMLYGDSSNKIVMRTADSPQGTWSNPTTLVGAYSLSGKYAPYIHPWSGTSNLPAAEQQYLYWNLSTWNDYQVRLMRTDLTKV